MYSELAERLGVTVLTADLESADVIVARWRGRDYVVVPSRLPESDARNCLVWLGCQTVRCRRSLEDLGAA
jgi:hypothetical protein